MDTLKTETQQDDSASHKQFIHHMCECGNRSDGFCVSSLLDIQWLYTRPKSPRLRSFVGLPQ